jgi:hypothetical protein
MIMDEFYFMEDFLSSIIQKTCIMTQYRVKIKDLFALFYLNLQANTGADPGGPKAPQNFKTLP